MGSLNERRSETRLAAPSKLRAKVKSSLPVRVLDISKRGMQVELGACLRPSSECELRVLLDEGELSLRAIVRRCKAWGFGLDERDQRVLLYRAGLEFAEGSADKLAKLHQQLQTPPPTPAAPAELDATVATAAAGEAPPPGVAEQNAPSPARRPDGRVRIRINSEHVRRILRGEPEE